MDHLYWHFSVYCVQQYTYFFLCLAHPICLLLAESSLPRYFFPVHKMFGSFFCICMNYKGKVFCICNIPFNWTVFWIVCKLAIIPHSYSLFVYGLILLLICILYIDLWSPLFQMGASRVQWRTRPWASRINFLGSNHTGNKNVSKSIQPTVFLIGLLLHHLAPTGANIDKKKLNSSLRQTNSIPFVPTTPT